MTDAIDAAGLSAQVSYVGGGSSVGEKALANGEIGFAAMSRPFKPEMITAAGAKGIKPVANVIGLDGLAILIHNSNGISGLDFDTLNKIFSCAITTWQQIPGSGKVGAIKAYRRDDLSGTTDTFKSLVGIKNFGACVTVMKETSDIAEKTASEHDAIGYAGLSGSKAGNRAVAIAAKAGNPFVQITPATVRNKTYPLSRELFVYSASGAVKPNADEQKLLDACMDRSFIDPILQAHDFITLN